MKGNRVFRILGIAVTLSLLVAAIPATSTQAALVLDVEPASGRVGDTITVTGTGFTPSSGETERHVDVYIAADVATTVDDIGSDVNTYEYLKSPAIGWEEDPDEGEFTTTFTVPAALNDGTTDKDVKSGTYYIYVTQYSSTRIRAIANFTVIGGEVSIDPKKGPAGTEVEISGSDFGNGENIIIEYDGTDVAIESGDDETDSRGEFDATIAIPESTAGSHTITVIGKTSATEVEATFTVEPEITISPASGSPGAPVTISGTGFGNRSDVTILLNNAEVATKTTDRYGSFEVTFNAPVLEPGIYDIKAEDADNNSYTAEFTIAINATISANDGSVGTPLTISGIGFLASGKITVKYDDATLEATATADAKGDFSVSFTVPQSQYGEHTITATDGTNSKQFSFTVETTPPPTPSPLKPEMAASAKATAYFDWADVTDASLPITYTLQIASDQAFSSSSLVLEKTGLTTSEYTLTAGEKLASVEKEAPYYWRVKAVDGASNESEWTGAGSFYTGFQFTLPQWALYILYGIGAVLVFIFGFWLGRRTSYSY